MALVSMWLPRWVCSCASASGEGCSCRRNSHALGVAVTSCMLPPRAAGLRPRHFAGVPTSTRCVECIVPRSSRALRWVCACAWSRPTCVTAYPQAKLIGAVQDNVLPWFVKGEARYVLDTLMYCSMSLVPPDWVRPLCCWLVCAACAVLSSIRCTTSRTWQLHKRTWRPTHLPARSSSSSWHNFGGNLQ